MKTEFIREKAKSAFNLNAFLSPLVGLGLLMAGEIAGIFILIPLSFFLPQGEFTTHVLGLFSFAFISLAVLLWARFIEKSSWLGLGITKKNAWKDFLIGWGIGAIMLVACVLIMAALGVVSFTKLNFSAPLLLQFLIVILAWSIQGTTEELLARGWMFSSLSAKHSIPVGILVSSLFFMALHLGNDGLSLIPLLDLTLFGILTCLIMLKTGNLWVVSGIHAAWNCFQGNVFAFKVSGSDAGFAFIEVSTKGPDWLSGGPFGVEGSVVSLVVQSAMIAWLAYDLYCKKTKA